MDYFYLCPYSIPWYIKKCKHNYRISYIFSNLSGNKPRLQCSRGLFQVTEGIKCRTCASGRRLQQRLPLPRCWPWAISSCFLLPGGPAGPGDPNLFSHRHSGAHFHRGAGGGCGPQRSHQFHRHYHQYRHHRGAAAGDAVNPIRNRHRKFPVPVVFEKRLHDKAKDNVHHKADSGHA